MASAVPAPCECEKISHGDLGPVSNDERVVRVLSDRHFGKDGRLKPSALPSSHFQGDGLSLVRVDRTTTAHLIAVAQDILKLSGAKELRGALFGKALLLRNLTFADNDRAICVIDDPVLNDPKAIDNHAHAIAVCARPTSEEDLKELRASMMEFLEHVEDLSTIEPIAHVSSFKRTPSASIFTKIAGALGRVRRMFPAP